MSEERKEIDVGGRPSDFKEEFIEQAYKLCLLGATDKELGDFFGVTEQTVNNWKKTKDGFFESIKRGKMEADAKVAASLYHRALGFETTEVVTASFQGIISDMKTVKKVYPPDPTSAIFWLKNRQPDKWRDKQEVDHKSTDGTMSPQPKDLSKLSAEELKSYREIVGKLSE